MKLFALLILSACVMSFADPYIPRPPMPEPPAPFPDVETQAMKMLYLHHGTACAKVQEYRCAVDQFIRVLRIDPRMTPAHFNLALAYYHLGEYENAANHFRDILALEPNYMDGAVKHYLAEVEALR